MKKVIHDTMDNILYKDTEHGSYEYDYDDLYRLTSVVNPLSDDEDFTYDPVGNRLTSADTTESWSYNTNNELQTTDNTQYIYDDNGNMTQKTVDGVVTNYVYGLDDRLTEVRDESGSLIAEYYYDPFGRRLWKDVGGTKTYFLYADEGLIGEYDGTGTEIKTYGYVPGSSWTTDPIFMKQNSQYYFYHNDHLGTPQKMTSVNGAVVWSAKYSSFGKAEVGITSTITNNLRFPGQYYDQETGLYYNWNRYYDSNVGRYLIKDPAGLSSGINLFIYTLNNPIKIIDPLGLKNEISSGFSCCTDLRWYKYKDFCKTGITDIKIQYYWHEYAAYHAYQIYLSVIGGLKAGSSFGSGSKTFLIGQRNFLEQWAQCDCTQYRCFNPLKKLGPPLCYPIKGTEFWKTKRFELLKETVYVNPWDKDIESAMKNIK